MKLTEELLNLIEASPSCFHATENFCAMLRKEGYIQLLAAARGWKVFRCAQRLVRCCISRAAHGFCRLYDLGGAQRLANV